MKKTVEQNSSHVKKYLLHFLHNVLPKQIQFIIQKAFYSVLLSSSMKFNTTNKHYTISLTNITKILYNFVRRLQTFILTTLHL